MRARVRQALFRTGRVSVEATPASEVSRTVDLLRPWSTPIPLIRLGAPGDGGYLVPDDLEGITACFSPGVDSSWSFESALLERYGIPSYLCDRFDTPPATPHAVDNFWLGPSSRPGESSLADWVALREAESSGDLILQMDIEGAEYLTLLSCSRELLLRFRIIVLEFHRLELMTIRAVHDSLYRPLFERLLEDFFVVHIHPNNAGAVDHTSGIDIPMLLEVTLHRRDRASPQLGPVSIPHDLDSPNVEAAPDIQLSDAWHRMAEPRNVR